MQQAAVNSPDIANLEASIVHFGREIFKEITKHQLSTFDKKYWSGRIMDWSMRNPAFKLNMFRLVDVLPSLRSVRSLADHAEQYLTQPLREINRPLSHLLKLGASLPASPFLAASLKKGVREMAAQFIAGEDAGSALKGLRKLRKERFAFTVDLLGEYSVSEPEAEDYLRRYIEAVEVLAAAVNTWPESQPLLPNHPGETSPVCISVKLSALYSQCSSLNFERSAEVLTQRLQRIARLALQKKALIYVDAEDSATNNIIYEVFMRVFGAKELCHFPFPGVVLQAYTKNSEDVLRALLQFAKKRGSPIAIRLVKGAYWDLETTLAQQNSWESPLWKKKESSDANYEKLSLFLVDNHTHLFPAFASHNVRSLAHACVYAKERGLNEKDFELQMLYGMADPIAKAFVARGYLVRFYVPLGAMLPGMGYLVRRLLENTSNESFLRHTFFEASQIDNLLKKPTMQE